MEDNTMKKFIKNYIHDGFGKMNKNDFEVAIFNEIMKWDEYKDLSDFKLSTSLRIPESKVKRLRYEANLKYQEDDSFYLIKFLEILSKSNVNNDVEDIKLIVTDRSLRQYIKNAMYDKNLIIDTSFNTDIIITNIKDLEIIVKHLYDKDIQKKILKQYKTEVLKDKCVKEFKDLLSYIFANSAAGIMQTLFI